MNQRGTAVTLLPQNRPPFWDENGPRGLKMVAIEMPTPHSYSTSTHIISPPCTVWPHYSTRQTDRQTDRSKTKPFFVPPQLAYYVSILLADNTTCMSIPENMFSRINCGWSNIKESECNNATCCFDDTTTTLPVCYYTGAICYLIQAPLLNTTPK